MTVSPALFPELLKNRKLPDNLVNEGAEIRGGLGGRGIAQHALPVGGSFRHRDAGADFGVENRGIQLGGDLAGHVQHLTVQGEALVVLIKQDAQHLQPGIVAPADRIDGFPDLGNAQQAENLDRKSVV